MRAWMVRAILLALMVGLFLAPSARAARDPGIVQCHRAPAINSVAQVEPTALACWDAGARYLWWIVDRPRFVKEVTVGLVVAAGTSYAACACDASALVNRIRQQVRSGGAALWRWFGSPGPRRGKTRAQSFAAGCAVGAVHAFSDALFDHPSRRSLSAVEWGKVGFECVAGGMFAAWRLS